MIGKHKTKEEWQQIVDDFIGGQQTQTAYCKKNDIKYGTFKNWYHKLKDGESSKSMLEAKADMPGDLTKGAANKDFVGFKLVSSITRIKLPNGISVEVATGDVVGLIEKLLHVA